MVYLVSFVLMVGAVSSRAETLAKGSVLTSFSLEDQHGKQHRVGADVRAIVFSREMEAGGVVKEALGEEGADLLGEAGALYIADVSGMPGLIRRLFALPKLRKRKYPILLDTDGELTEGFPILEAKPTLLRLEKLRIVAVEHPASAKKLRARLRDLAAQAPPRAEAR